MHCTFTLFFFKNHRPDHWSELPRIGQYFSKDSVNVITFGASTVEGVNGLNFQTYLTTNFVNCYINKTINIQKYGVSGETTAQGLLRIDNAIADKTGFIVILMEPMMRYRSMRAK